MSLTPNAPAHSGEGEAPARLLAILCGGGDLPAQVAGAAAERGRVPLMIGIVGAADARIEAFPHLWIRVGELGRLLRTLEERNIGELAIIGAMTRPELADVRLDWGAVKRLASLAGLFRGGDNHLLSGIARLFEQEGVAIVGVHEIAPQLLVPQGRLGGRAPSERAEAAARLGFELIGALSPFDVGQAAVVANGRVLAVEAAEGTDAMLQRIADMRATRRLRFQGRAGVLVKAPKRNQDLRLDMPVVGPMTVERARNASLEGIALAAGRVLVADRASFIRAADKAGLFVLGLEA